MRTFIAIELPKEIKQELTKIQEQLKASEADVKWVNPENIHLTLKFLGEIDEIKLKRINQIIQEVAKDRNGFRTNLSTLGVFPRVQSPRVIWVGIDKGDQEIKKLAEDLEEKIAGIGIAKEKRNFSTHITIGRVRTPHRREQLIQDLNKLSNVFSGRYLGWEVTKVTLFKSTLTPKGPLYEALQEASLTST
ncbi:MAG: RNA 2',3'-cyclic phosphodiesterase [Candidatus Omnitrophota bacterium]